MSDVIDSWSVNIGADTSQLDTGLKAATSSGKQFSSSLISAFQGVAAQGKGLSSVVDTLALSLSKMALQAAFKPLGDAVGTLTGNLISGQAFNGGFGFASGGVIDRGMPVPFAAGGVVSSPVSFPMAGGATGLMGERGAEAIMPLARGPDGRLGVQAGGAGGGVAVTFNITTADADSFRRTETQVAAMLARAVGQGQRNL